MKQQTPTQTNATLVATPIVRVFKAQGAVTPLPDPNPALSVGEVRRLYAPQYPGLINAVIEGPVESEHSGVLYHTYTFAEMVAKKG